MTNQKPHHPLNVDGEPRAFFGRRSGKRLHKGQDRLFKELLPQLTIELGEVFDLSPRGIRTQLDLNKPIYAKTSAYGHFGRKPGRDGSFSWEKTDLVPALKAAVKAA